MAREERRLAAIVSADVVGYSRLMGADEAGTLAAFRSHRAELIDPKIAEHGGRIVKTMGDGLLVEFASVVEAVQCAVAVQQGMAERNAGVAQDRRIVFRIGVNLGDVIIDGDDIFGGGVNLAARLQELAEPGTVCLSGTVHDHVGDKLDLAFEDTGEHAVKNIARPVRVWRWRAGDGEPIVDTSQPVPGFGGRPAIAVLAFDNLSGDAEQEFFADGIAEDILTRLAMWRWLPVIARNSSFTYKGKSADVKQIGRDLGARYVLEGSVRKAGNRVRITAQLIDAGTGHHVWADRYDRDLDDIFAVQDEITEAIVSALEPAVGRAEMQRSRHINPSNLVAWDLYHRGMWHFGKVTKEDMCTARQCFEDAWNRDPNFALSLSMIAMVNLVETLVAWADDPATAIAEAHRMAFQATGIDDQVPMAQVAVGYVSNWTRQHDDGLAAARRAIELNPSLAIAYHALGVTNMFVGAPRDAVEAIETAIRISPNDYMLFIWLSTLSASHYMARDFEPALAEARKALQIAPHYPLAQRGLVSSLALLGRIDEARLALRRFRELTPNYSMTTARPAAPFREEADFRHYMEGLRLAGLPDE